MARGAAIAPPPRETVKPAEPEAPKPAKTANIETPTGKDAKYINFRVSREDFVDIKTAALREDLTLGAYLMHTHRVYQAKKG